MFLSRIETDRGTRSCDGTTELYRRLPRARTRPCLIYSAVNKSYRGWHVLGSYPTHTSYIIRTFSVRNVSSCPTLDKQTKVDCNQNSERYSFEVDENRTNFATTSKKLLKKKNRTNFAMTSKKYLKNKLNKFLSRYDDRKFLFPSHHPSDSRILVI